MYSCIKLGLPPAPFLLHEGDIIWDSFERYFLTVLCTKYVLMELCGRKWHRPVYIVSGKEGGTREVSYTLIEWFIKWKNPRR